MAINHNLHNLTTAYDEIRIDRYARSISSSVGECSVARVALLGGGIECG